MKDSPFDIADILLPFVPQDIQALAVGVSGGPDSMALCHMLCHAAQAPVHVLTVDHGLRAEAAEEAKGVAALVADWPQAHPHIMKRAVANKKDSRIQEEARHDRYEMMAGYCADNNIQHLFVAHHLDDQAETFLFRLAKGSGLDGLGAMRSAHDYNEKLRIIRPFLDVPKDALVNYCKAHDIPFIEDPSNEDDRFARVRLRQSYDVLAEEGLSAKRLSVTARRLGRARDALAFYTKQAFEQALIKNETDHIQLDFKFLQTIPAEICLRVLSQAVQAIGHERAYQVRMEKREELVRRLFNDVQFKKTTLGGCIIALDREKALVCIEKELGKTT